MKLLNKYQLRTRITENYDKQFWDRMTQVERDWVKTFENLQYQIERNQLLDAIELADQLNPTHSKSMITKIAQECALQETSNPLRVERIAKFQAKRRNGRPAIPKTNSYTPTDMTITGGKELSATGQEREKGITLSPEDGYIAAIDAARVKGNRSLEKLIEDAKLSKEAKEDLLARTQTMTYTGMTYTLHGTQFMNLNYVLQARNGQLYVQDQHDRIQTLALYLKRHTADSYATHAIVSYPSQPLQTWVFKAGHRSNVEGSAIQWVS